MKILALDQSYTRTGVAIIDDGKPRIWYSIDFRGNVTRSEKRLTVRALLTDLLTRERYDVVVVERVRLHRNDKLNIGAALALATLVSAIIDTAAMYATPVQAIDTRSWKSIILGNGNATKDDAVWYARVAFGATKINHDEADALCIGLAAAAQPGLLVAAE